MATGTVKWFNDAKGFGFIEPDGGGADVFAHFSAIAMEGFKTLKQGSRVSYEVTAGPKGQLAQNIQAEPSPGRPPAHPDPAERPAGSPFESTRAPVPCLGVRRLAFSPNKKAAHGRPFRGRIALTCSRSSPGRSPSS